MLGTLFGVELHRENVTGGHRAGKGKSVIAFPDCQSRVFGNGVKTVDEIKVGSIRNTVP